MYVPDVKNIIVRVFNLMSRNNETRHKNGVNIDEMQVFVKINNAGTKINVDVSVIKWLTNVYVIKDLFRILVFVNGNVINYAT